MITPRPQVNFVYMDIRGLVEKLLFQQIKTINSANKNTPTTSLLKMLRLRKWHN